MRTYLTQDAVRGQLWKRIGTQFPQRSGLPNACWTMLDKGEFVSAVLEAPGEDEDDAWAVLIDRACDYLECLEADMAAANGQPAPLPAKRKRRHRENAHNSSVDTVTGSAYWDYLALGAARRAENKDRSGPRPLATEFAVVEEVTEGGWSGEHAVITITALPWVGADDVRDAYSDLQRALAPGVRSKQGVKPRQRARDREWPAAVFRFVTIRRLAARQDGRPEPTWGELCKEWNSREDRAERRGQVSHTYGEDTRAFKQAYRRARSWLYPRYKRFWLTTTT